jgi:hypothetical protein
MSRLTVDVNITNTPRKLHVDDAPSIQLTAPLLIRILEWAREDAKTDIALHEAVERIVDAGPGVLDSYEYDTVLKFPKA